MYSMTGFGSSEGEAQDYKINIEIKSVNNRFRDIRFRMPNFLSFLEISLRKRIETYFKRGSFDVFISLKKQNTEDSLIDFTKLNSFINSFQENLGQGYDLTISPSQFLRAEFQQDQEMTIEEKTSLGAEIESVFSMACEKLKTSRKSEGENVKKHLADYVILFEKEYREISKESEGFRLSLEAKFNESFKKFKEKYELDEGRFNQEVVHYLEKMDIQEEIDRLEVHLGKLKKLFQKETEVGRQIDFLLQEINRETNTIGSKSNSSDISGRVVEMKTYLEKIREQNLNIE